MQRTYIWFLRLGLPRPLTAEIKLWPVTNPEHQMNAFSVSLANARFKHATLFPPYLPWNIFFNLMHPSLYINILLFILIDRFSYSFLPLIAYRFRWTKRKKKYGTRYLKSLLESLGKWGFKFLFLNLYLLKGEFEIIFNDFATKKEIFMFN